MYKLFKKVLQTYLQTKWFLKTLFYTILAYTNKCLYDVTQFLQTQTHANMNGSG